MYCDEGRAVCAFAKDGGGDKEPCESRSISLAILIYYRVLTAALWTCVPTEYAWPRCKARRNALQPIANHCSPCPRIVILGGAWMLPLDMRRNLLAIQHSMAPVPCFAVVFYALLHHHHLCGIDECDVDVSWQKRLDGQSTAQHTLSCFLHTLVTPSIEAPLACLFCWCT